MIKIAICDDEQCFVNQIRNILETYCKEIGLTIFVEGFYDGSILLDRYSCQFDIIFLDIKMPHIDGINVAEKIRERDSDVTIIFLTGLLDRAVEGYRVKAANYLIKPIRKDKLIHEIDRWIEDNRTKKQECLLIDNKEGQFRVSIGAIRYVETHGRNLLIHAGEREIISYKKLKQIKERLEPFGFAQSHKSILINMSYVDNIEGNDVILITKEKLQVSRSMRKEFMQQLAIYLGGKL